MPEAEQRRRIVRLRAVMDMTSKRSSAIYAAIAEGTFPKAVPIGKRAVGWLEHEIEDWINQQIVARDSGNVGNRSLPLTQHREQRQQKKRAERRRIRLSTKERTNASR